MKVQQQRVICRACGKVFDWDLVDWSHLTGKERRRVRTFLTRRAYLLTLPCRYRGQRSYAVDEIEAIDWALALAAGFSREREETTR